MKKIFILMMSCLCFISTKVNAIESMVVLDQDSGVVLDGYNIHTPRLIASTTKIMTALVVINNTNLDGTVTVGDEILGAYGSSIYLKPKERMKVIDMLYGLMMRSGNDAACALAKYTSGSIEAFVGMMNETAKSLGMNDTVFGNPHGLDDLPNNKSSAYDLAILMREAMKNDVFRRITSTKKYTTKSNFNTYEWYNKNELLTKYKYAIGGKIGYTEGAGHTFVSSASKDGKNLIIVTLVDPDRFNTHKNLYEKYFPMYNKYELVNKNNPGIRYKRGYKVFTLESFSMLVSDDEKDKINKLITLYDGVDVGENAKVIGSITILKNDKVVKKMSIYASKNKVKKTNFFTRLLKRLKW